MTGSRVALLTGASGFVGSHLANRLIEDGWQVHLVVRDARRPRLRPFQGRAALHAHDGSTRQLADMVGEVRPDVVFHLASLVLTHHRSEDVDALVTSNVLFGTQLLQAMAEHRVARIISTGTFWQHYQDSDYNPVNLYAATKQAFVDIARYYVEAAGCRMIALELFDTYGPDDPRPKIVQLLAGAAQTGRPLAMSSGDQLIDLVHVEDVSRAYTKAAARLLDGSVSDIETYAVSSGVPMRLRELVATTEQAWGVRLNIEWGRRLQRKREVMVPWTRGLQLPEWRPLIPLADGLAQLKRW
jgi:nucleoside-diphosphate-sugar epimerase